MSLANAGMKNDARQFRGQQRNQMAQFNANLNNSSENNAYNARLSAAELNNDAVNQEIKQLFAFRNQPMDEYSALRAGTDMPQADFSNTGGSGFNAGAAMRDSAAQQMASANNQAQGTANMWGTIGGAVANTDWGKVGDKVSGLFGWGGSAPPPPSYDGWNIGRSQYGIKP